MSRYLRIKDRRPHDVVPREDVPRTEREETRRAARDWLRDRDETNVADFERQDGDELFDWAVGNGWE